MIKEIIKKWDLNKGKLQTFFETKDPSEFDEYWKIIKAICIYILDEKYCINADSDNPNDSKIHVIDDGDYQGCQLFILPNNSYQPNPRDYIYTYVWYGSCSGCDTLMHIQMLNEYGKLSSPGQVKDYMTLSLHLIQRMDYLFKGELDYDI